MRDLDPCGAEREREIDHRSDVRDIGAVHDRVHGEGQLQSHHLGRERALAREGAVIAGDVVGGTGLAVLDRDLHVIEADAGERSQRLVGDADRRGDQVGVEACRVRGRRDVDEVAARARLAAREMHLQHAQRGRFLEHTRPGRGVELVIARIERQRIRAIGAAEGATVRQLGEKAERFVQCGGTRRRQVMPVRDAA